MKFKSKIYKEGTINDGGHWCKDCKGFLFFPKTINGETRWLEFSKWKKEYPIEDYDYATWESTKWLD
jgi:hypothetical protein